MTINLNADRDAFYVEGDLKGDIILKIQGVSGISPEVLRNWMNHAPDSKPEDDLYQAEIKSIFDGEPETILVPAGEFIMGSEQKPDVPDWESTPDGHAVTMNLTDFRIAKYPVTNYQYWRYLSDKENKAPNELGWHHHGWSGVEPTEDEYKLPVSGVSWFEAFDFCIWLSEKTNRKYTLPTEAQWEKAARGDGGNLFPWGNEWDPKKCNPDSVKTPVDAYEKYPSPYGCVDMVGNIREWTFSLWGEKRRMPDIDLFYPLKDVEKSDLKRQNSQVRRVTRGGAALPLAHDLPLRAARRGSEFPINRGLRKARIGFRVALKSRIQ